MFSKSRAERERLDFDVVIVGAGPAGLACAIRLKQLSPNISVCILEKGAEVGSHLISGAILEPKALDELIPSWRVKGAPVKVNVAKDRFLFLLQKLAIPLFLLPPQMLNRGNYIISLGALARWMAERAEELGVEILPGFSGEEILFDENDRVKGVATGSVDGQPGVEIHARQTIFAEGCYGFLSRQVIDKYGLERNSTPQTYGLGIKEVWQVSPEKHRLGMSTHTLGWPLGLDTYGGGFIYHLDHNRVAIGFITGLDYSNPYLSPYGEMQRMKKHPYIRSLLTGGKRIGFGARTIVEGGMQAIPELTFPGGMLIGDSAGFLNILKIKGIHTAMKSGMIAAEALSEFLVNTVHAGECLLYPELIRRSWLWKELKQARNIRPGFYAGMLVGMVHAAIEAFTGGIAPWTLKTRADYPLLKKLHLAPLIDYGAPDGEITFDRLSSVYLSGTDHTESQPGHIKLRDPKVPLEINLPLYGEPAQRYCPARVYEVVMDGAGNPEFRINAQNCVHCMACAIKDPSQNIVWMVPTGGDGPNYSNM